MRSARGTRDLDQLQPLPRRVLLHTGQPGDIAARMREARGQTGADRIVGESHHDRDRRRRLLGCERRRQRPNDDDFRTKPHQFGGEPGKALSVSIRPTALDRELLIAVAERAQSLPECLPIHHTSPRPLGKGSDPAALC